jgi:transcriptional regulator with XRE-family HTH domain
VSIGEGTDGPIDQVIDDAVAEAGSVESLAAVDADQDGAIHDVGDFIREQRERANLSLRRLAERAGVSNPYLSQIERGIRKPSAEILKRLSRALEISAESLYTRAGLIDAGPAAPTVVEAVEADRRLTPRQKQVLLDLYRALAEAGTATEDEQ